MGKQIELFPLQNAFHVVSSNSNFIPYVKVGWTWRVSGGLKGTSWCWADVWIFDSTDMWGRTKKKGWREQRVRTLSRFNKKNYKIHNSPLMSVASKLRRKDPAQDGALTGSLLTFMKSQEEPPNPPPPTPPSRWSQHKHPTATHSGKNRFPCVCQWEDFEDLFCFCVWLCVSVPACLHVGFVHQCVLHKIGPGEPTI